MKITSSGYPAVLGILACMATYFGVAVFGLMTAYSNSSYLEAVGLSACAFAFVMAPIMLVIPPLRAYFSQIELKVNGDCLISGFGMIYALDSDLVNRVSWWRLMWHRGFHLLPNIVEKNRINGTSFHQSMIGKLFNYGTVLLFSPEQSICIDYVYHPAQVAREIGQDLAQ